MHGTRNIPDFGFVWILEYLHRLSWLSNLIIQNAPKAEAWASRFRVLDLCYSLLFDTKGTWASLTVNRPLDSRTPQSPQMSH